MSTYTNKIPVNPGEAVPGLHITHSLPGELDQYEQDIRPLHAQEILDIHDILGHWDEVHSKVGALASHMATHHSPKSGVEFIRNEVGSIASDATTRESDTDPSTLDVAAFLKQHVMANEEDGSLSYVGEQPSDRHKAEVVRAIFEEYSDHFQFYVDIRELVLAAAGPKLPADCAKALILDGEAWYVVNNQGDFENVTFDQSAIDVMLGDAYTYELPIRHYDLLDSSVDLQLVVNRVCAEYGPSIPVVNLINMPSEITVSDTDIYKAADSGHVPAVVELMRTGRFGHLIGDARLLAAFNAWGMAGEAYELGFWKGATVDDYIAQLAGTRLSVLSLLADPTKIQGLATAADVERLLTEYTRNAWQPPYRDFLAQTQVPGYVQSAIFNQFVKGIAYEDMRADLLLMFTDLPEADYETVFDKYSDLFLSDPFTPEMGDKFFMNASQRTKERFEQEYRPAVYHAVVERIRRKQEIDEANQRRKEQREIELTLYRDGVIEIDPLRAQKRPNLEHIYDGLEYDHCVKQAPRLTDQLRDRSRRHDVISYVGGTQIAIGTSTYSSEFASKVRKTSELSALRAYKELLDKHDEAASAENGVSLTSLRDDITYIGKNEYKEAVKGIAAYWKALLDRDSKQQIFICTQAIGSAHFVKSDEYMIDRIVAQFSDEELKRYKGRFTMNQADIMDSNPKDVRIVLVDDWTISGSQLRGAASRFIRRFPQFAGRIEIQLIAASRERISLGLEEVTGKWSESGGWSEDELTVPVRAYYVAHAANSLDNSAKGVCITGSHSSVDFGFENVLSQLIRGSDQTMPPIANIVRPYRQAGYRRVYPARMDVPDESPDENEGGEE